MNTYDDRYLRRRQDMTSATGRVLDDARLSGEQPKGRRPGWDYKPGETEAEMKARLLKRGGAP